MGRWCWSFVVLFLAAAALASDWKLDIVHLKNGSQFEGAIAAETKDSIRFKQVIREPGRPTVILTIDLVPEEIARIQRLAAEERQGLLERLSLLEHREEREQIRMRAVELTPTQWPGNERALQFQGKYFVLSSNAREDIVRQAAVRLEDIFAAFIENLGTRREPSKPIQVVLFKSQAEYQSRLKGAGLNILNPAYYDPKYNLIVAASDVEPRGAELEKLRQKHEAMLQELDAHEAKLKRHFNGKPPQPMLAQIRDLRRNLQLLNATNETAFERLKHPLFTMLYHEAFHAYLENFMYPSTESPVPRWLNEGLAQIFETALVEGGDLRVGSVDVKRLTSVQDAIRQKQFVKLVDLLGSQPQNFQVAHQTEALASDRHFQAAWALAYYLTFDRKLIGSDKLDRYIVHVRRGVDRLEAFRLFVGQPLPEFENQFHQFVMNLRPDGTLKNGHE
jgi:hypothetical protein